MSYHTICDRVLRICDRVLRDHNIWRSDEGAGSICKYSTTCEATTLSSEEKPAKSPSLPSGTRRTTRLNKQVLSFPSLAHLFEVLNHAFPASISQRQTSNCPSVNSMWILRLFLLYFQFRNILKVKLSISSGEERRKEQFVFEG